MMLFLLLFFKRERIKLVLTKTFFMKYVNFYLTVIVLLIFTSSSTTKKEISSGYYPGEQLPNFTFSSKVNDKQFDLNDYKGKKVVLNFWAAYDAASRAKNVQLHNFLKENYPEVTLVSISLDENQNVFEKTLQLDNIEMENQFCEVKGTQSEIYRNFRLKGEFKSYLLDENGVIAAIELTPEKLQNLL